MKWNLIYARQKFSFLGHHFIENMQLKFCWGVLIFKAPDAGSVFAKNLQSS